MKQLIIILSVLLTSCKGQEKENNALKLTDLNFTSIFGTAASKPGNIYSLLGSGFFRTVRSENADTLIIAWIKQHPNAVVIPVSSIGPVELKSPDSKMVYCWVIDKNDTLNNYLVKEGCFPGGTMIRPKTWDEMDKREKEIYDYAGEKVEVQVFVEKPVYDKFIEQIKSAELFARANKLGIWKEKKSED